MSEASKGEEKKAEIAIAPESEEKKAEVGAHNSDMELFLHPTQ